MEESKEFKTDVVEGVKIVGGQEAKIIDKGTKIVGGRRPADEIKTLDKRPEKS